MTGESCTWLDCYSGSTTDGFLVVQRSSGLDLIVMSSMSSTNLDDDPINGIEDGTLGSSTEAGRPMHHPPRLISDYLAGKKKSQNKNFDDHITTI